MVTSPQYGFDPSTGALASGGAYGQTIQAMTNIQAIFEVAGYALNSTATSCVLYLEDLDNNFNDASDAYKTFFPYNPHPSRTPLGMLAHYEKVDKNAIVAVRCEGYPYDRRRVAPPNFFTDDFNSQGILAGGRVLYTAAQVGADPVTGNMVSGGAGPETTQAMQNLQVVFANAFPSLGNNSLSERACDCQVLISPPRSNWMAVKKALIPFFNESPSFNMFGGNAGFGAAVEIACTGTAPGMNASIITGDGVQSRATQGILVEDPDTDTNLLYGASLIGDSGNNIVTQTQYALFQNEVLFGKAFPIYMTSDALQQTAAFCTLTVQNPDDASAAMAVLQSYFDFAPMYPTIAVVAGSDLPDEATVALQCSGVY